MFDSTCDGVRVTEVSQDECRCFVSDDDTRIVTIDFGRIPVDSTVMKSLKLTNGTCNEESYEVHRDPATNPLDVVFHIDKYSWSLAPSNSVIFQVRYDPPIPNERSVDYFTIVNNGIAILKLVARATCIAPKASITNNEISMLCSLNGIARKRVKIINESEVPANFVFDVDMVQSSFKPEPTEGRIDANSSVYIVVTFEPKFQGHHVSQLPCLIQHQAPILIRLYGYCDKQQRGKNPVVIPTLIYPSLEKNTFKGYMSDCDHTRKIEARDPCQRDPISLSNGYIDFGRFDTNLSGSTKSAPRTTCFTNHDVNDMLVKWHEDVDGIFSLVPNTARVRARETCLFEVRFHPSETNNFYEREFQALVFHMVEDSSVPSFSFSMIASLRILSTNLKNQMAESLCGMSRMFGTSTGHTFPADTSSWIPQYHVPRNIIMPPCLPSCPVYSTFIIKKFGHLPIMYRFFPPSETCFTVKPMQGIIRKNYQVIVVEMFPKIHDKLLYERWSIRFNGNPNYETFIDFRGYADYPYLNISEDFITFPSTHPGSEHMKQISMLNPTRHQISYRFVDIPSELSVNSVEGTINSNEILTHNWTFCPSNEGYYEFRVLCCYSTNFLSTSRNNETIMHIELAVVGNCEMGYLVATPGELMFDEQSYQEPKKLFFQLTNLGNVDIPYRLIVNHVNWPYEEKNLEQQVQLDPILGILCPGNKENIQVTLVPRERGYHEISIRYFVRRNSQNDCQITTNESVEICRLKYFCHMPVIKIEDLLHHRIGNKISKYILWRLLNINKLNGIMNDLQPGESHNLTMNIPPMIVSNDTSIVKLFITNPTSARANWSFKQIKICSCSKISEKLSRTFHSMKYDCPHRKICKFYPKSGTLEAQEKTTITMELRYEVLGKIMIKWDLEIGHDRHVYLSININCLSEHESMAFPLYGPTVELKNIYIGDPDPINQIFWIYNPTKNDISYSMDTISLKRFNERHNLEIFDCLNPCGIITKLSLMPVILKFQPRQLGISEVIVPLTIGNEITKITIKGECTEDPFTRITKITTPRHDIFQIDELPVRFNTDNVDISSIPLHSRATRIIMIHNCSEDELVAYEWKRYELPGILEIDLEPRTGRIQPESMQTFRLIVTTGGKPCRINADVTCEFINQSKKRAYERNVMIQQNLCEQIKDYFTITEKGTTFPKLNEILLDEPKLFKKLLTVRCQTYGPEDEDSNTLPKERIKMTPSIEIPIEKISTRFCISREEITISKFILEGMIWNIVQSTSIPTSSKSFLKYSQIAIKPMERKKIQDRSYVTPSSRMMEKLLENMILEIIHKEFALDMIHFTRKTDARQATYRKIWQKVPGQEEGLEQSPEQQRIT